MTNIYLCKADLSILGSLNGIKTETCNFTKNLTDFWEITFEVDRFVESDGKLVQSDYYDSIQDMMKLYFESDDEQLFFVIDSEPIVTGEELQEKKSITAHSIECELNHMFLSNLKINCGTKDSQEYLATDENGEFNNIDAYTGLPKEYISFVNYDNNQLSLMHLALQGTDWTVKDDIDPEICSIKKSFESSDSIYSFLMKTVSSSASVIFEFDRKNKQIGIVKAEDLGEDTGVFVTMRNLMNSFEVTSSSDNAITTKLIPKGANNLGIEQVNFGKDEMINLDYFMNTVNEYGDYKFVSKELHDKYNTWKNYRDSDKVTYDGKEYTRRELYIELTKLYNSTNKEISELYNRLPNDGCVIDYKTFSLEELKISLNAYNKALVTLITLYKDEFGVTDIGEAPNYSPTPSTATNIKDTPYWYDFYAYKERIIPQVEQCLKMYCKTDSNGNLMIDSDGNFIELEFGNPDYYANEKIVVSKDAYLYEWSLYGLDELESKKKAWSECANVLFNECFIKSGTPTSPVYRTPDDNGWNELTKEQQKDFTSKDTFINKLNQYLDYMSFNERDNSITKTKCKGIIRQCEDAISERQREIELLKVKQNEYNLKRSELANSVTMENVKIDGIELFNEADLNVIKSMMRKQDYNNEYILTTNLDDIVSTVNIQEELYQDALIKLDELSQPQYSFKTELDNLFYLEEFKAYRESFDVGNFIRVGLETYENLYDNNFIKLRLISISYNPLEVSEDLSVTFSTMTKSLNNISDLAFLLDKSTGSTSSSSGSSSSGKGGNYGDNDANVQISNNMLNALLKTEMFATTVTDVILDSMKANKGNFNTLFAHSGVFDSLEAGRIKVSGDCLVDKIQSNNYISGQEGSYLDLTDGGFEFAGGALKYSPSTGLVIDGYSNDTDLSKVSKDLSDLSNGLNNGTTSINGGCITTGNIKSKNWNGTTSNLIGNTLGSIICLDDGKFNFAGGKLKWDGTNLTINGSGKFTGSINVNDNFIVDEDGNVTANTLTANGSGSVAGWSFNNKDGFYYENLKNSINKKQLCEDGIYWNNFWVNNDGIYFRKIDYLNDSYDSEYIVSNYEKSTYYVNQVKYINISLININIDNYNYTLTLRSSNHNYDIDITNLLKQDSYDSYSVGVDYLDNYQEFVNQYGNEIFIGLSISTFKTNDNISYHAAGITSVEISYDWVAWTRYVPPIYKHNGIEIDTKKNKINGDYWCISDNNINIIDSDGDIGGIYGYDSWNHYYSDIYRYQFNTNAPTFSLTPKGFSHLGIYNSTTSSGSQLRIDENGTIQRYSSSSERYKKDITTNISQDLNPQKLYDLNIVSYKYKDDYLETDDQRYKKEIPGFIAEDVYEKYPIACNLDKDGKPEMWEVNILFPAALALIQEQHKDIEVLKEEIEKLKNKI